jgi:hypothetical protein
MLRTRVAYDNPGVRDDCACPGCRNYRAAIVAECFPADLLAACDRIGINVKNAFETEIIISRGKTVAYTGQFPFFGEVHDEGNLFEPSSWSFSSFLYGAAAFADGLISIRFSVEIPWVLPEQNTYG